MNNVLCKLQLSRVLLYFLYCFSRKGQPCGTIGATGDPGQRGYYKHIILSADKYIFLFYNTINRFANVILMMFGYLHIIRNTFCISIYFYITLCIALQCKFDKSMCISPYNR